MLFGSSRLLLIYTLINRHISVKEHSHIRLDRLDLPNPL